jgi:hypothetical protein
MTTQRPEQAEHDDLLLTSPNAYSYVQVLELARRGRVVHNGTRWGVRDIDGYWLADCAPAVLDLLRHRPPHGRPRRMCWADEREVAWDGGRALATTLLLTDHGRACLDRALDAHGWDRDALVVAVDRLRVAHPNPGG